MTLAPRTARDLRAFLLEVVVPGLPGASARAEQFAERLAPRQRRVSVRGSSLAETRRNRRRARGEHTSETWRAVQARARGICEACGLRSPVLRMDHWSGGSGRRTQDEGPETCWALCPRCERARTANSPSAAEWNEIRRAFCERVDHEFRAHVEHQPVARRAGH